jgi:hypothetical protein
MIELEDGDCSFEIKRCMFELHRFPRLVAGGAAAFAGIDVILSDRQDFVHGEAKRQAIQRSSRHARA